MLQIIEGIDNEILAVAFFFTIFGAVVIPFYFMRPTRRNLNETEVTQNEETSAQQTTYNTNNINENRTSNTERTDHEPVINLSTNDNHNVRNTSTENVNNSNTVNSESSVNNETATMISIKVMNQETFQLLTVDNNMLLKDLKEKCFPVQVAEGKTVRIIYSGRVLQGDTYPLRYLGIMNGSVLHSVVSEHTPTTETQSNTQNIDNAINDLDLSDLLIVLFTLMLVLLWGLLLVYTNYFSVTSIVILGILTILFILFVFAS